LAKQLVKINVDPVSVDGIKIVEDVMLGDANEKR